MERQLFNTFTHTYIQIDLYSRSSENFLLITIFHLAVKFFYDFLRFYKQIGFTAAAGTQLVNMQYTSAAHARTC